MGHNDRPGNGILVLDKPGGWTSHDVVAKVRRWTKTRRAGHTGTLDPMATGVLVVCLGQATRVIEYMAGQDKAYHGIVCLGIETDTYDAQGQVVARRPIEVGEAALREAIHTFVGKIEQVPPMFSAIKREGRKLYDLARQGIEVEREPRAVTIYSIDLIAFDPPHLTIDVRCSAGTYIRSLAHDLGRKLGCGAHLSALRRTAAGDFTLAQAVPIETLESAVTNGSWVTRLHPLEAALTHLPPIALSADDAARVRHGRPLPRPIGLEADRMRAYDPAGQLIGVLKYHPIVNELRPEKIFGVES